MMGKFENLSHLIEDFAMTGPSGCACALGKNGNVVHECYAGYADIGTNRPITPETVYRLISMTKVIVCAAALCLFERGKYLLNDPVYEYFPEYRDVRVSKIDANGDTHIDPAINTMLIRHAFTMGVGLPYPSGESTTASELRRVMSELKKTKGKFTLRDQVRAISQVPIAFEPGTQWLYGYGHELVAGLIEVVSGKSVGQFLQDEIFDPLDMKDTGYRYHDDIEDRMAGFYVRGENGELTKSETMSDEYHRPDAIYEGGGAGLYATIGDYLKFTQMMANGGKLGGVSILGRKTIDLMRRNQLNAPQLADFTDSYRAGYGYGLGVRTMIDPAAAGCNCSVGEFGWTGRAGTWTSIDPDEGFSVVYMHQLSPNMKEYCHHRIRAAAYGCL